MDGRTNGRKLARLCLPAKAGATKKIGGLTPLLVWVPLLIVNNYSEFQVNIFSNNRDIRKCQKFLHATAIAITIP